MSGYIYVVFFCTINLGNKSKKDGCVTPLIYKLFILACLSNFDIDHAVHSFYNNIVNVATQAVKHNTMCTVCLQASSFILQMAFTSYMFKQLLSMLATVLSFKTSHSLVLSFDTSPVHTSLLCPSPPCAPLKAVTTQ